MSSHASGTSNGERESHNAAAGAIGDGVERIGDTAQQAWSRTRDAFTDIKGSLDVEGRVKRSPYGTVAAALGIGYVLGGGLFSPLTARLARLALRAGLRVALVPALKDELFGLAEGLTGGARDESKDTEQDDGEGPAKGRSRAKSSNTSKGR